MAFFTQIFQISDLTSEDSIVYIGRFGDASLAIVVTNFKRHEVE